MKILLGLLLAFQVQAASVGESFKLKKELNSYKDKGKISAGKEVKLIKIQVFKKDDKELFYTYIFQSKDNPKLQIQLGTTEKESADEWISENLTK